MVTLICGWSLGLNPANLLAGQSLQIAGDFFAAFWKPAFRYEAPVADAEPFLVVAIKAVWRTLRFALLAMTVAVPCACLLALGASKSWWPPEHTLPAWLRIGLIVFNGFSRAIMALARSIHELIWGLLFITAIGLSSEAAVIAIAIPYAGILAKIYGEFLEEHERAGQEVLRAIGGSSIAAFFFGLLPNVIPDLISYTFYRLECAMRSAAVLGFVGIETIGHFIRLSSNEFHHREVWTYLYLLLAVSIILEWWGSKLRSQLNVNRR